MWWGWWLTLGWFAGSIYGVLVTRRQVRRRAMRRVRDSFLAAQSGQASVLPADPEVRYNPLGLSPEQQRRSDISSMIDAVFGNSLPCTQRCTCGAWCWRMAGHAGSCGYFHVPDSVYTP